MYFGKDKELEVGRIIKEYNPTKVMIHYGSGSAKKSGLLDRVIANGVANPDIDVWDFAIENPELTYTVR